MGATRVDLTCWSNYRDCCFSALLIFGCFRLFQPFFGEQQPLRLAGRASSLTRSAFPWFESYQAASASLYDQVWMTGWRFTSSIPAIMRSLSSCFEVTRMWRRTDRANLEKKPSMRLSHEPCLGVKVNSKRPGGRASSQAVVSLDMCAE